MTIARIACLCLSVLSACGEGVVSSADAGARPDAGAAAFADAATLADGALLFDAGGTRDAGSAPDAATCTPARSIVWPQGRVWNHAANLTAQQIAHLDALPFDGLGVNTTAGYMAGLVNMDPSRRTPGSGPLLTYQQLKSEVDKLSALRALKENFLAMHVGMPPDFFDDDRSWSDWIATWVVFAQVARDMGWKGIFFDNEVYQNRAWADPPPAGSTTCPDYWAYKTGNPWLEQCVGVKFPSHTEAEYVEKARLRGRAVMAAVRAEFPEIVVMVTHGPYIGLPWASYSQEARDYLFPYWMDASLFLGFFTGMLEETEGTATKLVDGGEFYGYRTADEFGWSYRYRKYDFVDPALVTNPWVPAADRTLWSQRTGIGFGLFNRSGGDVPMTPSLFAGVLTEALVRADDYVWFYTELPDAALDWTALSCDAADPGCSAAWIEPAREGRDAARARRCP